MTDPGASRCPECHGSGRVGPVHINRGDRPHEWRESMPCTYCAGAGSVSDDVMKARALGEQFRTYRLSRDESFYEAAERLGLSTVELSALEHGRGGMAAWQRLLGISHYDEIVTLFESRERQ